METKRETIWVGNSGYFGFKGSWAKACDKPVLQWPGLGLGLGLGSFGLVRSGLVSVGSGSGTWGRLINWWMNECFDLSVSPMYETTVRIKSKNGWRPTPAVTSSHFSQGPKPNIHVIHSFIRVRSVSVYSQWIPPQNYRIAERKPSCIHFGTNLFF